MPRNLGRSTVCESNGKGAALFVALSGRDGVQGMLHGRRGALKGGPAGKLPSLPSSSLSESSELWPCHQASSGFWVRSSTSYTISSLQALSTSFEFLFPSSVSHYSVSGKAAFHLDVRLPVVGHFLGSLGRSRRSIGAMHTGPLLLEAAGSRCPLMFSIATARGAQLPASVSSGPSRS